MSTSHQLAAFVVGAKHNSFWAYLIAVWLWGVILNLFLVPGFYGIALSNLGLALGILAWARLGNQTQNNVLAAACVVDRQR